MSNSYFRFKAFTVQQELCAMKVCTDACLFGAWVAQRCTAQRILDIGAGTGLLSLMLAQQSKAAIDSIEIDKNAAQQARGNFDASPWKERLHLIQADARQVQLGRQYDLVVSNPPFFHNDLKSANPLRNIALHSSELTLQELFASADQHLLPEGRFALLLPWKRKDEALALTGKYSFFINGMAAVKQTPQHDFFRVFYLLGRNDEGCEEEEISIKENERYSEAFTQLLHPYYLHL